MPIFIRYIVAELAKVFLVALSAMTLTMILGALVQEAYKEGLGLKQVVQLIPYILPDALRFTMPATALFATCSVFGRMSSANEIVALKSLGISPVVVIWPTLVLAFLLSLSTVWINDLAVSWGRNGVRRVVIEAVDEIAYSMLRVQRSYSSRSVTINVKRVEDRTLVQPTFVFAGSDQKSVTVRCAEAELKSTPDKDVLLIECRDGAVDVDGEVTLRFPGTIVREIPLQDISRQRKDNELSPSWLPLWEIAQRFSEEEQALERQYREMAVKASLQMLSGDFASLTGSEWESERSIVFKHTYQYHRLATEPHRRWSNGFSCLCFVMIGVPMAIRLRNSDFLTSFFLCFLPILVVYYPLLMFGVDRAKNGDMPPMVVWIGNVILCLWGWWMFRKVMRY